MFQKVTKKKEENKEIHVNVSLCFSTHLSFIRMSSSNTLRNEPIHIAHITLTPVQANQPLCMRSCSTVVVSWFWSRDVAPRVKFIGVVSPE